jgi:hypothetical protein
MSSRRSVVDEAGEGYAVMCGSRVVSNGDRRELSLEVLRRCLIVRFTPPSKESCTTALRLSKSSPLRNRDPYIDSVLCWICINLHTMAASTVSSFAPSSQKTAFAARMASARQPPKSDLTNIVQPILRRAFINHPLMDSTVVFPVCARHVLSSSEGYGSCKWVVSHR